MYSQPNLDLIAWNIVCTCCHDIEYIIKQTSEVSYYHLKEHYYQWHHYQNPTYKVACEWMFMFIARYGTWVDCGWVSSESSWRIFLLTFFFAGLPGGLFFDFLGDDDLSAEAVSCLEDAHFIHTHSPPPPSLRHTHTSTSETPLSLWLSRDSGFKPSSLSSFTTSLCCCLCCSGDFPNFLPPFLILAAFVFVVFDGVLEGVRLALPEVFLPLS